MSEKDEIFVLDSFTMERHLIKTYGIPQTTMTYVLLGILLFMFSVVVPYKLPLFLASLIFFIIGVSHLGAGAITPPTKILYRIIASLERHEKKIRDWLSYRPREDTYEVSLAKLVKGLKLDRELRRRHVGLVEVYIMKLVKTGKGLIIYEEKPDASMMKIDTVYVYGRQVTLHFRGVVSEPGYYVVVLLDRFTRKIVDKFVLRVY